MTLIPLFELESKAEIAALKQALEQRGLTYQIGDNNDNMRGMSYGRDCVFLFPPRVWGNPEDADAIEAVLEEIRASLPPQEEEELEENAIPENQIRSGKQAPIVLE